ncbi:MAG TPA: DivIVA domain-containing protein [Ilumatobacteraceae bacterium]|nr:DivIVA domain-containing protein [Ilumatobacteraceae bacterium]
MAVSISRPDPTSPASVAEAKFSTARRGYDPDEVRELLRSVAAELRRLQDRELHLERELRTAQSRAFDGTDGLDDDTVARLLGEETLHVLQTARESASQIKIRAEEGVARILREATEDANRTREQAEIDASRKRTDAAADADAEVSLAKQPGREMVNEARAYRERVLSELTRRREMARQQIEQLILGRDRLLQVFERARLVAVDVVSELTPLGEPDEYVDLSPTTGPVPMMVPARSLAANADPATAAADVADVDGRDAEVADDADTDAGVETEWEAASEHVGDDVDRETATAGDSEADVATDVAIDRAADLQPATPDEASPEGSENVVELFPGKPESEIHVDTGALFARLRAGSVDSDGAGDDRDRDTDGDTGRVDADADADASAESIFDRRDAALVPLIVASARKLKRVLADEQNDVLDALRKTAAVTDLSAILPPDSDHIDRYADAIGDELHAAAVAGAGTTGDGSSAALRKSIGKSSALDPVRSAIAADLVGPLRERLSRSVTDGAGDNDDITKRVRAVYREWKTQHIDDQLDDVFRLAYGSGALAAAAPGTRLCWMVDPHGPACPDAEDNALAGPVDVGDAYPTGHTLAPAHAGCRCLLVPAPK